MARTQRAPALWLAIFALLAVRRCQATSLTSAVPSTGPLEGITVSLTGVDLNSATHCHFGAAVVPVTHLTSTTATCQAPFGTASDAAVAFAVYAGSSAVSAAGVFTSFQYHPSLFVADHANNQILRFNADSGVFVDIFVKPGSGGLLRPYGMGFGPDKSFFVASAGTSSILKFNGNTGEYVARFCSVPGEPRGMVFHYHDLFVASSFGSSVLRFHGRTGAPRGVFVKELERPWGLAFDKLSNNTYITTEEEEHVYRYKPPNQGLWGELGLVNSSDERQQTRTFAQFDKVFTNERVEVPNGLVFSVDSLYVVGPESGNSVVRYNRSTGEFMHNFHDAELVQPTDIKEYKDYLYVADQAQVRKYNRLNGEFIRTHTTNTPAGVVASYLLFHSDWQLRVGE